jgi:ectoine hydroxylase-related dioxygenase (phytanoyl-CoA dioxygenase family)
LSKYKKILRIIEVSIQSRNSEGVLMALDQIETLSEGLYMPGADAKRITLWCRDLQLTLGPSISKRPWSQVRRVTDPAGRKLILKALTFVRPKGTELHATLAKHLNPSVPELIASKPEHGLYLFEDAGDGKVAADGLLRTYGKAQAHFADDPVALEAVPSVWAVNVLDHFGALLEGTGQDAKTNIFHNLDPIVVDRFRRDFDSNKALLRQMAERVDAAKPTLNHCDLTGHNAVLRADGSVCIIDWDDAIASAPGWSLTPSFNGCLRVYAALRETSLYKNKAERTRDRTLMSIYFESLTHADGFDRRDLLEILPMAAMFGVLRETTSMAPYDLSTEADVGRRDYIAKIQSQRVPQVFRTAQFLSTAERRQRPLPPRRLPVADMADENVDPAHVAAQFLEAGAVHLKGCFSPELIREAAAEFAAGEQKHIDEIEAGAALRVGDRRHMVTLETNGVFGRPEMLASERLLSIFDHCLGSRFVLGSATAVVSMPGGRPQRWHRDNFSLFEEDKEMKLPPILISAIVPLVPINNIVGSTQIAIGSNRDRDLNEIVCPLVEPQTELGDCYLMDSALMHRGMPNQSDGPRPILALVYQRAWYVDVENFGRQERLKMSPEVAEGLPEARRELVQWALQR